MYDVYGTVKTMNPSIDELLSIIRHSASRVKVASAKLFLELKLLEESNEKLLDRINHSSCEYEVKAARYALWRKGLDESFDGLLDVIHTSSDELQISEAASLLGEKGYAEAVLPLIDLLLHTDSSAIRDGAAFGLRELADQRAFGPLVETLQKYPEDSSLVYALETLDCTDALEPLVDLVISYPNSIMICSSVFECVKNIDIASVPVEIAERCRYKTNEAIYETNGDDKLGSLEHLLGLLK